MFSDDADLAALCFCGRPRDEESDYYCSSECARIDAMTALTSPKSASSASSSAGSSFPVSPFSLTATTNSSSPSSSAHSSMDYATMLNTNTSANLIVESHYRRIQMRREKREEMEQARKAEEQKKSKRPLTLEAFAEQCKVQQDKDEERLVQHQHQHKRGSSVSTAVSVLRMTGASYSTAATSEGILSRETSTRSNKSAYRGLASQHQPILEEESEHQPRLIRKKSGKKLKKQEKTVAQILEELASAEKDFWVGYDEDDFMRPQDVEAPFMDDSTRPIFEARSSRLDTPLALVELTKAREKAREKERAARRVSVSMPSSPTRAVPPFAPQQQQRLRLPLPPHTAPLPSKGDWPLVLEQQHPTADDPFTINLSTSITPSNPSTTSTTTPGSLAGAAPFSGRRHKRTYLDEHPSQLGSTSTSATTSHLDQQQIEAPPPPRRLPQAQSRFAPVPLPHSVFESESQITPTATPVLGRDEDVVTPMLGRGQKQAGTTPVLGREQQVMTPDLQATPTLPGHSPTRRRPPNLRIITPPRQMHAQIERDPVEESEIEVLIGAGAGEASLAVANTEDNPLSAASKLTFVTARERNSLSPVRASFPRPARRTMLISPSSAARLAALLNAPDAMLPTTPPSPSPSSGSQSQSGEEGGYGEIIGGGRFAELVLDRRGGDYSAFADIGVDFWDEWEGGGGGERMSGHSGGVGGEDDGFGEAGFGEAGDGDDDEDEDESVYRAVEKLRYASLLRAVSEVDPLGGGGREVGDEEMEIPSARGLGIGF